MAFSGIQCTDLLCVSYLTLVIVLWPLCVIVLGIANTKLTERVPLAGTSTWVISAACHPAPREDDSALGEVCWGRVTEGSDTNDTTRHPGEFSLANSAVLVCPGDERAPGQGRLATIIMDVRRRLGTRRRENVIEVDDNAPEGNDDR
jgi:hypothetical protein